MNWAVQAYVTRSSSSLATSGSTASKEIKKIFSKDEKENIIKKEEKEHKKEEKKEKTEEEYRVRKARIRSAPASPRRSFVATVPEPFQMTLREEGRRKEQEIALSVITQGPAKPSKHEQEQFRAIALPDHVKEARYQKIIDNQEKKKIRAKEEAVERMQKSMKPFSFAVREEEKMARLQRSGSSPELRPAKPYFEASPFPEAIFTDYASEQMKERENYRNIQRKLRQDLLLSKASFPPRMQSDMIRKKLQQTRSQSVSKPVMARRQRTDLARLYTEHQQKLAERERLAQEMVVRGRGKGLQERVRKRPSSAEPGVRRRPFSVMSFEPGVEGRSLEAGYNLTANLRMERMERRKEEERKRREREERQDRERQERGRRRRMNNPVWENIRADLEGDGLQQKTKERMEEERERTRQYRCANDTVLIPLRETRSWYGVIPEQGTAEY